ncbi:uncharacterized protein LOC129920708 [Episyrphus balteatus]|uniref:uncharacterized protein LOC129920708 n=1 Tax=Episyrphus balteatus TaxID=286459 RepID=UPI002485F12D|nr:uncharacterized protein LOC129920708 [Episyrphus balteatus]
MINDPSSSAKNHHQTQSAQNSLEINVDHHHHHHHHHHQQQQEQMQQEIDSLSSTISSPKPNQVSTVLLYGIPIVSLYIESQERLCLAQISNTLLKQFSYNEIHNRRVALGITCVQCTPVQLEILRRAGAMPVSSRRCGMITRREAERLCKSFLGDNTPPRLPDDFAFSVHHKCAWGCRGSFLPSRYNSSRAKCIKCSYCGLFFSPNKFIFHSHRIGPGDKYVQPDAANFNSWRRHMKLSGNPPEEITHAWEDVKAMFNGGTRKRLMTSSTSSSSSSSLKTTTVAAVTRAAKNSASSSTSSSSSSSSIAAQSPKRLKETSSPGRTNAINSHQVGQFSLRPSLNVHHPHQASGCNTPLVTNQISSLPSSTPSTDITLPFSRHFMMDYMWHTHAQSKSSVNSHLHFSNYSLPWIKGNAGSLIFGNAVNQSSHVTNSPIEDQTLTISINSSSDPSSSALIRKNTSPSISKFASPPEHTYPPPASASGHVAEVKSLTGLYNNSAFKPVIQLNRTTASYSAATTSLALETVAAVAAAAAAAAATSYDNEHKALGRTSTSSITANNNTMSFKPLPTSSQIKESYSSDDEMVDIETTEDEEKLFDVSEQQQRIQKLTRMNDDHHHTEAAFLVDAPIEVDNSNDEISWKGLKKEQPITPQQDTTCRMQTPTSSLISHSPASSITSEHHVSYQLSNKSASSTPDIILSASPASSNSTSLNLQKTSSPEQQQRNVAAAIVSAFSHNQHHNHHHHHLHPHHHHHHPHQSPTTHHSVRLPLPQPTVTTSIANGTTSLMSGHLASDINSNSVQFGSIGNNPSSNKTSPFLVNSKTSSNNNDGNNAGSSTSVRNAAVVSPTACVNNEFWSVARLSFNRPNNDYSQHHNVPITATFHRHNHDIAKHFQAFRNHGQETPTQTNGVG